MTAQRPLPVTEDRDTGGFWAAAREHRLVVRTCAQCGAVLHMPRSYCHSCGTWSEQWTDVAPRGKLYSWSTVEHQVHPGFPVPYTVVLVELDDRPGVRLVGQLPGTPELHAGQAMEAWFDDIDDTTTVPQWRPAG